MIKTVEASGKTRDDAVKAAMDLLRAELSEIDEANAQIELLEKGRSGFFGIGSTEAKVRVTYKLTPTQNAVEFVKGLLDHMDISAQIHAEMTDDALTINLSGENMGVVIGRRGDTLDAIQYLTSIAVNRGEESHLKITIDTENYRKKREESLENLAKKVAARVLKYKKNVTLEPMSAYERRVIHSTLQSFKGITTYSTGNEPNRRVVVALAGAARTRRTGSRPSGQRPAEDGE